MRKGQFHSMKDRLYRHFVPVTESGCWLWTGKVDKDGYGTLRRRNGAGGDYKAHRVSYEVHHGSIPSGLDVCHSCDVRCCINPSHLRAATRQDNIRERTERKREHRGEQCSYAKITSNDVRRLRQSKLRGRAFRSLCKSIGISSSQGYRILNGECWACEPL